ncbi:MAG: S24 family peptidase, partial [Bacteroidota bacterium]
MSRVNRTISSNLVFLSQYAQSIGEEDFSSFMDCTPEEFGAYLEGEPIGVQHLVDIHRYFGIPYEDFLHRDLSRMSLAEFSQLLEDHQATKGKAASASDGIAIPLVPQKASASYSERQREDHHLAGTFPTLKLPESFLAGKISKRLRAFEIEGFSMAPNVQPGDIVVGEKQDNIYDVLDGECYVLVLVDGIVLKRVYLTTTDESIFQSFRL